MEQDHQTEQVVEPKPQTTEGAGPAPHVPATALKGASNAALAAWLGRATPGQIVARTETNDNAAAMRAVETRMGTVKTAAEGRATQLNTLSDQSLVALQSAQTHLTNSLNAYSEGYGAWKGIMDKAQQAYEDEKAIIDAVQGILVGAALAVIGPEVIAVRGAVSIVEAATEATTATLGRAFAAGVLGEMAETAAGAGADAATPEGMRARDPSTTLKGAGMTPGEKYQEAFGKIAELVAAMPKLGRSASANTRIVSAVGEVTTEAARVGAGGTGKWSAAQIEEKATAAESANTSAAPALVEGKKAVDKVKAMSKKITEVPVKNKDEVETMLWNNWIASLGSNNEILDDNSELQEYLEGKGLLNPDGGYLTDLEQGDAVHNARREVLKARGIDPDSGDVDTLYRRMEKQDEIKRRVVGQKGRCTTPGRVEVAGVNMDFPHGGWPEGTQVDIVDVVPKDFNPGGIIAEFGYGDFYAHGIPAGPVNDPGPAPPASPPAAPSGSGGAEGAGNMPADSGQGGAAPASDGAGGAGGGSLQDQWAR